jgi:hypothetical protein
VSAGVPDIFCRFYCAKNHKIVKNSASPEARKYEHKFGTLRILEKL